MQPPKFPQAVAEKTLSLSLASSRRKRKLQENKCFFLGSLCSNITIKKIEETPRQEQIFFIAVAFSVHNFFEGEDFSLLSCMNLLIWRK